MWDKEYKGGHLGRTDTSGRFVYRWYYDLYGWYKKISSRLYSLTDDIWVRRHGPYHFLGTAITFLRVKDQRLLSPVFIYFA